MPTTSSFNQIIEFYQLETIELSNWIAHRWVRPEETGSGFVFDDTDCARVALIVDLRRHLQVNDESLALILSLLDQLYSTRHALRSLEQVIKTLPQPLREEMCVRLRESDRE